MSKDRLHQSTNTHWFGKPRLCHHGTSRGVLDRFERAIAIEDADFTNVYIAPDRHLPIEHALLRLAALNDPFYFYFWEILRLQPLNPAGFPSGLYL